MLHDNQKIHIKIILLDDAGVLIKKVNRFASYTACMLDDKLFALRILTLEYFSWIKLPLLLHLLIDRLYIEKNILDFLL